LSLSVFDAARDAEARPALIFETECWSFQALAERVERRLGELAAADVLDPTGTRPVAVVGSPAPSTIETLLALFAAGTPALLLHQRSTLSERAELIERAAALPEPTHARAGARGAPHRPSPPERIAAFVPTSGTTGTPRLARLSHGALSAAAGASAAHLGVEADDRWLLALPLAHVGGLMILVRSLVARTAVVLFDPHGPLLSNLERLKACVAEQRVTLLSVVPALLDRLLAAPGGWSPPASLRAVLVGGAACPVSLLERAHAERVPVLTTYGLTETCAQVATRPYAERWEAPAKSASIAPAGVALPGFEIRVRAPDGVLEVRGASLFSGYAGEPGSDPRGGWFATRDRGSIDARGELTVQGRMGDVIVSGGENVDPVEVELALASLPGVVSACVLGVADPTFGEVVTALLVVAPGGPQNLDELCAPLRARLAAFKLPRRLVLVPELPLLPSGKLDRQGARLRYASG
jgi:o-succinylbenzoate---CoA ligase